MAQAVGRCHRSGADVHGDVDDQRHARAVRVPHVKIAVVTSTGELGGAESIDIHTLRSLCQAGDDVEVAMPAEGALRGHLEAIGARCRVIESGPALDGLSRRYGSARAARADVAWAAGTYQRALGRWLSAVRPNGVLAMGFRAQLALS